MKKLLLQIVFGLFAIQTATAQVPQAVCYQGVATDPSGRELQNQNIKIRLSILKTSGTTGTESWVETHATSTDGFGLFDTKIGQGTRTGGTYTQFSAIPWGTDRFFLKVEMDITGGNNFLLMGTNEIVSVPYALYAERSNTASTATFADSARVANRAATAAFADSARVANRAATAAFADSARVANRATTAAFADSARVANRAATAAFADSARVANRAATAAFATLADSARVANRANSAATATFADSTARAATALDDRDRDPLNEIQTMTYDSINGILRLSNPAGGSSSVINFTSTAFSGKGASFDFPLGISGDYVLITTNYTVPAGKTLFVTAVDNALQLNDGRILFSRPGMPILGEGTRITSCYCSGLLANNRSYVEPVIIDLTTPTTEYTVPAGRTLVIKSGSTSGGRADIAIDSENFNFYTGANQTPRTITIPSGKRLRKSATTLPGEALVFTGYLIQN